MIILLLITIVTYYISVLKKVILLNNHEKKIEILVKKIIPVALWVQIPLHHLTHLHFQPEKYTGKMENKQI